MAGDRQPCTWMVWSLPPVCPAIIAMWLGVLLERGIGEEVLAETIMLRVRPVHRDIALLVLDRAERVEAVHCPAVHRVQGPRPAVIDIVRAPGSEAAGSVSANLRPTPGKSPK